MLHIVNVKKEKMFKRYRLWFFIVVIVLVICFVNAILSKDNDTAKKFANELYSYPLPLKTVVMDKGFDYGVAYGGGPWGSGGRPTAVAYLKLSTELSEQEVLNFYQNGPSLSGIEPIYGFEVYFQGKEEVITSLNGTKSWYEGTIPKAPDQESNEGKPIKVIVQIREEFYSPLGEFAK